MSKAPEADIEMGVECTWVIPGSRNEGWYGIV